MPSLMVLRRPADGFDVEQAGHLSSVLMFFFGVAC
jgi:hypothetical protein